MTAAKPLLEIELRPIEAPPHATEGAYVYVLLPTLGELLGAPAFGRRNPICLRGAARPFDGWSLFGAAAKRRGTIH